MKTFKQGEIKMGTRLNLNKVIENAATLKNKKIFNESTKQYTLCLDFLDISHTKHGKIICDKAVDILKGKFSKI
jgi:hypothetical protein